MQRDAVGNLIPSVSLNPNDFTLLVSMPHRPETVSVFASAEDIDLSRFKFPISKDSFTYFPLGGGLAQNQDSTGLDLNLVVNKVGTFNIYFSSAMRTGNSGTELHFGSISDTFGGLARSGNLNLLIYIDLNDDAHISTNELKLIKISLAHKPSGAVKKTKNYRFSSGQAIGPFKTLTKTRFVYFHITSTEEANRYRKFLVDNIGDYQFLYRAELVNDYSKSNYHVVFCPMSETDGIYQPYNFNGENELIFESVTEKHEEPGFYIFMRSVEIEKKIDQFQVIVEKNGQRISLSAE